MRRQLTDEQFIKLRAIYDCTWEPGGRSGWRTIEALRVRGLIIVPYETPYITNKGLIILGQEAGLRKVEIER